jgi:hypothetical protein
VSPVENPLDTTSAWYRYFIPIGPPTYGAFQYSDGKTRKSFPDYPNFTVGSDKVILTGFPANWNAGPTNQSGSSVIVLATSQLVNQQPLVYSRFDPPPGQGYSYILQPAHEPFVEYPVGELSVFGFGTASECSNVRRYRITGPASGPTVTMTSLYDTCASFPHPASQQGTTRPIGGGDTRLLDATVTVNPTIVYLVSNSACIPTGDSAIRSCARVSQWPLVGNSVLHWLFGVPGKDVYFPAIAGDVDGNLLMVFNQSQTNEYPSVYATGRRPTDAPYQVRAPTLLHTGEGPFDVQDPTSPIPLARWGDYSGAHVDPANGAHDIFVAAEFAKANGTEWSTWGHFLLHNNYPQ